MSDIIFGVKTYDSSNDWHVRWFFNWLERSKLEPRYPESFCRYWRIVSIEWILIWAVTTKWHRGAIRPFGLLATIPWTILAYWIGVSDPGIAEGGLDTFVTVCSIVSFLGICFTGLLLEDDDTELPDENYIVKTIWLLAGPFILFLALALTVGELLHWAFGEKSRLSFVGHVIKWLVVCVVIGALGALLVGLLVKFYLVAMWATISAGIMVLLFLAGRQLGRWALRTEKGFAIQQNILNTFVLQIERSHESVSKLRASTKKPLWQRFWGWISTTLKLVGDALKATKAGVCPPVYFVGDDQPQNEPEPSFS